MLPIMYFPAMLVSMYSTVEMWFILFVVPIIGNFMGVYYAVSMAHVDECDEAVAVEDIVYNPAEAAREAFIHRL